MNGVRLSYPCLERGEKELRKKRGEMGKGTALEGNMSGKRNKSGK